MTYSSHHGGRGLSRRQGYLENNSRGRGRHRFEVHTISQALQA
jgi:hypothetical protein